MWWTLNWLALRPLSDDYDNDYDCIVFTVSCVTILKLSFNELPFQLFNGQ